MVSTVDLVLAARAEMRGVEHLALSAESFPSNQPMVEAHRGYFGSQSYLDLYSINLHLHRDLDNGAS